VASPSANVRFCTTNSGWSWSLQCEVVQPCASSQVFMYKMRRWPPPLSVTRPPPSSTTCRLAALRTFAVRVMVITTGSGPQENVMIPPAATAATTASEVQLAGVPSPTLRVGRLVSTGCACAGTGAVPAGLPVDSPAGAPPAVSPGAVGALGCGAGPSPTSPLGTASAE
jgi:hypothetical protein